MFTVDVENIFANHNNMATLHGTNKGFCFDDFTVCNWHTSTFIQGEHSNIAWALLRVPYSLYSDLYDNRLDYMMSTFVIPSQISWCRPFLRQVKFTRCQLIYIRSDSPDVSLGNIRPDYLISACSHQVGECQLMSANIAFHKCQWTSADIAFS